MFRLNKKNNFTIFLIFLVSFSILSFVIYRNIASNPQKTVVFELLAVPTPTPALKTAITSQNSIEGDITLILETKEKLDNQIDYNLFVTSKTSLENPSIETLVFSETINGKTSVELPFNTWSPDKKHFFIEQLVENSTEYLIFNASGEKWEDDSDDVDSDAFINVNDLYEQAEIPFKLDEVTGWAAPYLLIVTTLEKNNTNTEGPSYWFDVSRQNFTRLSTRF